MSEKLMQEFQIHYYLADDSHSMDAAIRNRAEKDFLEAVSRISEILGHPISVETVPYEEGGLKETFLYISLGLGTYLAPAVNNIVTHYFTKDAEIQQLDKRIKEQALKSLQLDNQHKEALLDEEENSEDKLTRLFNDKKVARSVSSYYQKIEGYNKVRRIGFSNLSADKVKEYLVDREYFDRFIIKDTKDTVEDDDASIEIISPILNTGTFKWRGIYKDAPIDFSMGDKSFENEVNDGQHSFVHGSNINCHLITTITYDAFGDEVKRSSSVTEVHSIAYEKSEKPLLRKSGLRKEHMKNQTTISFNNKSNQ